MARPIRVSIIVLTGFLVWDERSWGIDIQVSNYGSLTAAQKAVVDLKISLWEARLTKSPGHVVTLTFDAQDLGAQQRPVVPGIDDARRPDGTTLAQTTGHMSDHLGRPTGATITINTNASITWYTGLTEPVTPGAEDLYSVINHELIHALGFSLAYARFAGHLTTNPDGTRTYNSGGTPTATLGTPANGTHLDDTAHPGDLMTPSPDVEGDRVMPSALDIDILNHAFWADDCRTSTCGGAGNACNLTFTSCYNDETCKITHTMHNNQTVDNSCFYVEELEFGAKELVDESSVMNMYDSVATAELSTPVQICCGDEISEAISCTTCNELLCPGAKYWMETSGKTSIPGQTASSLGSEDNQKSIVCTSSVVPSGPGLEITYQCQNVGATSVTISWEGTPYQNMSLPPGNSSQVVISDVWDVGYHLRELSIDGGQVRGLAATLEPGSGIPTVSAWGLVFMGLLTLSVGTLLVRHRPCQGLDFPSTG